MLTDTKNTASTIITADDFAVHTMEKDLAQTKKVISSQPYDSIDTPSKTSPVNNSIQNKKPTTPTQANEPKTPSPFLTTTPKPLSTPNQIVAKPELEKKPVLTAPAIPTKQTPATPEKPLATTIPEKSGPFLTQSQNPFSLPIKPVDTPSAAPTDKSLIDAKWKEPVQKLGVQQETIATNSKKKFFLQVFILLIFLAILSGGASYLYFQKRDAQLAEVPLETPIEAPVTVPVETPIEPVIETPPVESPIETTLSISTDKPNYLPVNFEGGVGTEFADALKKYSAAVLKINPTSAVEFVVTDQLNNPLSLADFSNKTKISLSTETLASLADKFSLFVYIDQGNPKIGLSVDLKNPATAKTALLKEEASLITKLAPLYLDLPYSPSVAKFQNSDYNKTPVRYYNIISPTKLSIDYILTSDKIIVGTTRATATAIFDYFSH
jgi:hypothetical protein